MSNGLDPDQDQHYVGPDLGPYCLQMTKEAANKERVSFQYMYTVCLHALEFSKPTLFATMDPSIIKDGGLFQKLREERVYILTVSVLIRFVL